MAQIYGVTTIFTYKYVELKDIAMLSLMKAAVESKAYLIFDRINEWVENLNFGKTFRLNYFRFIKHKDKSS